MKREEKLSHPWNKSKFLGKKLSENQKLLEIKNMINFSTERLEERAKEIFQEMYLKEGKKLWGGGGEKDKKIKD